MASARPAAPTERSQRTRDRISAIAIELFDRHGFDAVTVAAVGAAAGVTERTVFRHFPNKTDLVLIPSAFDEFVVELGAIDPAVDPVLGLRAAIESSHGAMSREDLRLERRRVRLIRETPELWRAYVATMREFELGLGDWIAARSGKPADDLAIRMAVAAYGAAYRVFVLSWDGRSRTLERGLDLALAPLASGLGRDPLGTGGL